MKILFVGNIITLKGIDLAIEALHKSKTSATLTIVGSGNFTTAAKKLATRLGLQERVHFPGRLPRLEALNVYPDFDLFLFPTLHDTGGYAVIEAMFHGLPVICLDCGGPRIAVKDGAGVRVPLGSRRQIIARLADAIRKYDQNRSLLLEHGRAARQVIASDYDWDKKGVQLNALYERAIAEKAESVPSVAGGRLAHNRLKNILHRMFPIRGLAISAAILFIIGAAGFLSVNRLKADAQLIVEDTLPGLSDAGAANASMAESFNRVLLSLMAETPEERHRYRNELNDFSLRTSEALDAYGKSIFSEDDRVNYQHVLELRKNYHNIREQILTLIDNQKQAEALQLSTTAPSSPPIMITRPPWSCCSNTTLAKARPAGKRS